MAAINITRPFSSGSGGGGNLQLLGAAAMDATLRAVSDTANTASTLKLSTNLVQVASTIFGSGTQATSNFIIQKESNNDLIIYSPSTWGGLLTPPTTGNGNTMINGRLTGSHGGFGNAALGLGTVQADGGAFNFNVSIGQGALSRGQYCVSLGHESSAGSSTTAPTAATAIGYGAIATTTNAMALGNVNALLQIGGNFTPTARVHAKGTGATSATTSLLIQNSASATALQVRDDRVVIMPGLPTSAAGLPAGALWNNAGVLNIV